MFLKARGLQGPPGKAEKSETAEKSGNIPGTSGKSGNVRKPETGEA